MNADPEWLRISHYNAEGGVFSWKNLGKWKYPRRLVMGAAQYLGKTYRDGNILDYVPCHCHFGSGKCPPCTLNAEREEMRPWSSLGVTNKKHYA